MSALQKSTLSSAQLTPARKISISNPCEEARRGIVTLPLVQVTGGDDARADRLLIRHDKRLVRAQVDRIDPGDPARDVVSIWIDDIPPGGYKVGNETVFLDVSFDGPHDERDHPGVWVDGTKSVEVWSNKLKAYIHLPKEPWGWQGGAITSVQLDGREMLDAVAAEYGPHNHDAEKRLQVDRVSIANQPWDEAPCTEFPLYKGTWHHVASGAGPVRAFANVCSDEFTIEHGTSAYDCRMHRVISIFHDADYLYEELYVSGWPKAKPSEGPHALTFSAHYFMKMNCGVYPQITRVPQIPDWFAIGATTTHPLPGYGFAASVPIGRIDNPPEDYPNYKTEHAAFGWNLGYTRHARCLHIFKRLIPPNIVADEMGRGWFNLIFSGPRARVTETEAMS